jgi:alkylhydroperoxidase/carboxymuconolactone decarboxylase family protein YurZ
MIGLNTTGRRSEMANEKEASSVRTVSPKTKRLITLANAIILGCVSIAAVLAFHGRLFQAWLACLAGFTLGAIIAKHCDDETGDE